jgi:hypothetical protein
MAEGERMREGEKSDYGIIEQPRSAAPVKFGCKGFAEFF